MNIIIAIYTESYEIDEYIMGILYEYCHYFSSNDIYCDAKIHFSSFFIPFCINI